MLHSPWDSRASFRGCGWIDPRPMRREIVVPRFVGVGGSTHAAFSSQLASVIGRAGIGLSGATEVSLVAHYSPCGKYICMRQHRNAYTSLA